jgi:uncharacterized protein (TIGR02145 family)
MKTLPFLLLLILTGCAKDPFLTDDSGTFKDSRDKYEYKWVRIGTQIWMAENLAYLPAISSSSNGSETSPLYYVYDYEGNNISAAKSIPNYSTYGALYNWPAAVIACPLGWHLPTEAEWNILEAFLGTLPGQKMKSTSGWYRAGNGINISGLNVFPGGGRNYDGGFSSIGSHAYFWTGSGGEALTAWGRFLTYAGDNVGVFHDARRGGFSVRCVKN